MEAKRIALLVERDAWSRFVLRTALSQRGYRVLAARSRSEALDFLAGETATPDVVVLDDPGADGAYRVVALPQALLGSFTTDGIQVRLVNWNSDGTGMVPRLGEILRAVEELSGFTLKAVAG